MAHNYDKLWVQKNLAQNAQRRARQAIQQTGRALPCRVTAVNGALVTVAFEVNATPYTLPEITIPKAESPWLRMPTQVGDYGITVPADAYVDGIAGTGATPDLTPPANLSALVFLPVSSKTSPPSNPNAAIVQGPQGAIIQTTQGTTSNMEVTPSGITATFGSTTFQLTSSSLSMTAGGKTVTLNGSGLTIDGILFDTHYHTGVSTGSENTGGPA